MAADIPVMIGEQRFLQLCSETTWGTVPTSPVWIDVPVNDYTVRYKPKRRNGQARVGQYQRRYGANVSGHPSGNLVTPLYGFQQTGFTGSLAQMMLEWGFLDQENKFPRSKCAQWEYENHEDDKGQVGLRVNQITLAGSESGIVLTLELIGQSSSNITGSASPPNSRNKLVEFLFEDSTFSLGGNPMTYSAFQWSCQRNLDVIYLNSNSPTGMPKTAWTETFSVTPVKADDTYDIARDALGMPEYVGSLVLKGLHNGTMSNTWAVGTVAFPRLSLIDSDENGGTSTIMNPLTFDILKPDTSSNGSTMTWTTV
jgi:tail tube protein